MKRALVLVLCFAMVASLFVACGGGKNKGGNGQVTSLIYYVVGDEPTDMKMVLDKVNEAVVAKMNAKIDIRFVTQENYNLIVSSGENYDLILVADWLQFWDFAAKNAFAEITDEMIEKNAPNTIAKAGDYLNAGKINGKRYAIPQLIKNFYANTYLVRGDFMDKYNIPPIDSLDSFGVYLDAVAKNEKGIIPFEAMGSEAWRLPAIFYNEKKWVAPGAPSAASHYLVEAENPSPKIFLAVEQPEMSEFSLKMKDWNAKGYWSKSAMANKISTYDSFLGGKSASAIVGLSTAEVALSETSKDHRKSWDVRAFNLYNTRTEANSFMNGGVAIAKSSKNMDKSLQLIDLLHTDIELNKLLSNGIVGVHYKELEGKKKEELNSKSYPGFMSGLADEKTNLLPAGGFPQSEAIRAKVASLYKPSKVLNFRADTSKFSDTFAAMNDIYAQYTAARFLGFVDDVDAALATEKSKLMSAGVDKYVVELQKQLDEYIKTLK